MLMSFVLALEEAGLPWLMSRVHPLMWSTPVCSLQSSNVTVSVTFYPSAPCLIFLLVWLLRDVEHDHLMSEIERLPPSVETKVRLRCSFLTPLTPPCAKIHENVLLAKLAVHTVYAHLRSSINYGSFIESSKPIRFSS